MNAYTINVQPLEKISIILIDLQITPTTCQGIDNKNSKIFTLNNTFEAAYQ